MKLDWSLLASTDFDEITNYLLLEYRPLAAKSQADRILAAIEQLIDFPRSGRKGVVPGTYEKICTGTPYIASYSVSRDSITILRVYHGKRKLPLTQRTADQ